MNTDGHPAYTRYPHLMGKNYYGVAGDYINSEDNLRFTPWKKTFAFTPKIEKALDKYYKKYYY